MPIPHKKYFDELIHAVQGLDSGASIAVVSQDGLVLSSNSEDSEMENQLAALSSYAVDTSGRLFAIPHFAQEDGSHDATRTMLVVGDHRYICVTRLTDAALLCVCGTDKNKIATVMRRSLECVDDIKQKVDQKELFL